MWYPDKCTPVCFFCKNSMSNHFASVGVSGLSTQSIMLIFMYLG